MTLMPYLKQELASKFQCLNRCDAVSFDHMGLLSSLLPPRAYNQACLLADVVKPCFGELKIFFTSSAIERGEVKIWEKRVEVIVARKS